LGIWHWLGDMFNSTAKQLND